MYIHLYTYIHAHTHTYIHTQVVDLAMKTWRQRCLDPDCRDFRSELRPIPPSICPDPHSAPFKGAEDAGLLTTVEENRVPDFGKTGYGYEDADVTMREAGVPKPDPGLVKSVSVDDKFGRSESGTVINLEDEFERKDKGSKVDEFERKDKGSKVDEFERKDKGSKVDEFERKDKGSNVEKGVQDSGMGFDQEGRQRRSSAEARDSDRTGYTDVNFDREENRLLRGSVGRFIDFDQKQRFSRDDVDTESLTANIDFDQKKRQRLGGSDVDAESLAVNIDFDQKQRLSRDDVDTESLSDMGGWGSEYVESVG